MTTDGGEEAAALVPDTLFYAHPIEPGEPATFVWSERDAHAVAA